MTCPAQHRNCRHHKEEGRCDYCGYDFEKEYLIAEDAENARKQAAAIAQQRTKDEEKTQQAQREAALQSEIAAMKLQMAELLAQTGKRNQEVESLQAQLAKEAQEREAMQRRLDEEARKRNAERQAELRRQEEEAKARKAAEAKAKEVEALQAQLAKEAQAREAMQSRLDEEARKRNAERQAELRRQEEAAQARKAAEAKAKLLALKDKARRYYRDNSNNFWAKIKNTTLDLISQVPHATLDRGHPKIKEWMNHATNAVLMCNQESTSPYIHMLIGRV